MRFSPAARPWNLDFILHTPGSCCSLVFMRQSPGAAGTFFTHFFRVRGPQFLRSSPEEYRKLDSCAMLMRGLRTLVEFYTFSTRRWASDLHGVHTWNSGHDTSPVNLAALVRCLCCMRCTLLGSTVDTVLASVYGSFGKITQNL